jgi:hypothetical protein
MKTVKIIVESQFGILAMVRNIIEAIYNSWFRRTVEEFKNEDWNKVYKKFKENAKYELSHVFTYGLLVGFLIVPVAIICCIDYIYWEIYGKPLFS